jgi:hypothetical protein
MGENAHPKLLVEPLFTFPYTNIYFYVTNSNGASGFGPNMVMLFPQPIAQQLVQWRPFTVL